MKQANIDWSLIEGFEGEKVLTGYVPDPEHSHSGVTIATGVDLGQMGLVAIYERFSTPLADKLAPYAGLTCFDAVEALDEAPLAVTPEEAAEIDEVVRAEHVSYLAKQFDAACETPFAELPEQAQTVITSVGFQYGSVARRCPKFWAAATDCNWSQVVSELRTFGDRYPTRRNKEADHLEVIC